MGLAGPTMSNLPFGPFFWFAVGIAAYWFAGGLQRVRAARGRGHRLTATDTTLRASVCICTRNRPDELRRALESIAASRQPAHQIVVSDDSDGDETEALVAETPDPAITYVRGPRAGLGANRNSAIAATDGDFSFSSTTTRRSGTPSLATMERRLAELPPERRRRSDRHWHRDQPGPKSSSPTSRACSASNRDHTAKVSHCERSSSTPPCSRASCSTSVRFDTSLKYGFDEVDFTTQAVASGFEIVPCFEASNLHLPSEVGREGYGEAATAARLYVTFKRRRWTERSRLRGWLGFAVAAAHVELASVRRLGLRQGIRVANQAVATAWSDYGKYKRSRQLDETGAAG